MKAIFAQRPDFQPDIDLGKGANRGGHTSLEIIAPTITADFGRPDSVVSQLRAYPLRRSLLIASLKLTARKSRLSCLNAFESMEECMGLLRDAQLVTNLQNVNPANRYVDGITLPADPYAPKSPVQAASIDLHIGDIYLPGRKESPTGATQTKQDHVLKTGETAVVTTLETLRLPANVAAFGFPPSGDVSFKGLLMTNPGHVDPGYQGRLRFTVINMGKDPFPLEQGDRIVRLMFFTLENDAQASWIQRNPGGSQAPTQSNVNRLSKDFVDVERRATDIARKQGVQWGAGITIAVTLLVALIQLVNSGQLFGGNKKLDDLQKKYDALEKRVDVSQKLSEYDKKIADLETEIKSLKKGR